MLYVIQLYTAQHNISTLNKNKQEANQDILDKIIFEERHFVCLFLTTTLGISGTSSRYQDIRTGYLMILKRYIEISAHIDGGPCSRVYAH